MIGPLLIGLGLAILAMKDIAYLRRPAWRGEPVQIVGVVGLALFIGGVLLVVGART